MCIECAQILDPVTTALFPCNISWHMDGCLEHRGSMSGTKLNVNDKENYRFCSIYRTSTRKQCSLQGNSAVYKETVYYREAPSPPVVAGVFKEVGPGPLYPMRKKWGSLLPQEGGGLSFPRRGVL